MASTIRHSTPAMITVSIHEAKNDLTSFVHQAKDEDVIVTENGKPVAFIRGFESEDEFAEHQLLNDARFQGIVDQARREHREGRVTRMEEIDA